MLALLLAALASSAYSFVHDCSYSNSTFKINKLIFNPRSPYFGEDIMLYLEFNNTDAPVLNGTIATTVTHNSKPFSYNVVYLCSRVLCPIPSSAVVNNFTNTWPYVSGKVSISIVWKDIYNKQLLCYQINENTTVNQVAISVTSSA
jgi:hypothetical protein